MDNTTLTKEQLNVLMAYIRSRGFVAPFVILEILDHFACKVEEMMNGKHGMSFEAAMESAHRSFGVRGFAPLVQAYYAALRKKYMVKYREIMSRTLKSILPMGVLVVIGFLYYEAYIWAAARSYNVLSINICSFVIFAAMLVSIVLVKGSFYKRENPVTNTIMSFDKWIFITFLTMQPTIDAHHDATLTVVRVIAAFQSFILMYILLRTYCLQRTIKLAQQDINVSEQYYDTLMGA